MSDLTAYQSYWIFFQWINEQCISKDCPAVLCHLGLLLGSGRTQDTGQLMITKSNIKTQHQSNKCCQDIRINMVFKGQDDWVRRGLESTLCYRFNDLLQLHKETGVNKTKPQLQHSVTHDSCASHLKGDLSGHGEPVCDVGFLVLRPAFPAVQLNAAASGQQHLSVHLHRRQTGQLTH